LSKSYAIQSPSDSAEISSASLCRSGCKGFFFSIKIGYLFFVLVQQPKMARKAFGFLSRFGLNAMSSSASTTFELA
jgi:hypothetical protein